jgi:predicted dehydrogenase
MSQKKIRTGIIGCGGIAAYHVRNMFQEENTEIVALCDPFVGSIDKLASEFKKVGRPVPPSEPDYQKFLKTFEMDTVLVATPHAMHHDHTLAAMEAGLDVLLEKPMVVNTREALSLIEARDRTGKTLVIAFQGSLSPLIRPGIRRDQERLIW